MPQSSWICGPCRRRDDPQIIPINGMLKKCSLHEQGYSYNWDRNCFILKTDCKRIYKYLVEGKYNHIFVGIVQIILYKKSLHAVVCIVDTSVPVMLHWETVLSV